MTSEKEEQDTTTIRVKIKTKQRFDTLGSLGDTADTVLNMLIDFYKKEIDEG